MKKAFTLAEVMISITVIGVISAIVLPVAMNSRPNENVMKFKKAHTTLYQVISTLVSSDKYYKNGDLGITADNRIVTSGRRTYFCESIADLLSTKSVNCQEASKGSPGSWLASNEWINDVVNGSRQRRTVTEETIAATKAKFDSACKNAAKVIGPEIVTTDGITYYNAGTGTQFHTQSPKNTQTGETFEDMRVFSPPGQFPANYADEDGFDISYKIYCIDVDGIPNNPDDCTCNPKDECPFGYGIRADGKIMPGARAEEWMKKDPQEDIPLPPECDN